MLYLNIAEGCGPTGTVLRDLLRERGVDVTTRATEAADAVICWGNGYTGPKPSLNRKATECNKLQQLQKLSTLPEGQFVRTVPFFTLAHATTTASFPAFARKLSHSGGTDIRMLLEPEHASLFAQNGWNFATKYVPNSQEFRVWVYRRQHLGTYEKVLARPEEFLRSRRFGANFDNGYAFNLVPGANVPREAVEMAQTAVDALGLDFGAVDILKGRDNQFYVLEVNTAPGVEGPDRQVIQGLADKIAYWANHDYLLRTGDENAYVRPGRQRAGTTQVARDAAPTATRRTQPTPELPSATPLMVPAPRRGESFEAWRDRVGA